VRIVGRGMSVLVAEGRQNCAWERGGEKELCLHKKKRRDTEGGGLGLATDCERRLVTNDFPLIKKEKAHSGCGVEGTFISRHQGGEEGEESIEKGKGGGEKSTGWKEFRLRRRFLMEVTVWKGSTGIRMGRKEKRGRFS